MKFGKQLQKRQLEIPEYATSFVNYKALKKLIKQLSATPVLYAQNAPTTLQDASDAQAALQANKATFFFRLERELEKVNACYLQKEAELKLRLKTLLDKKKMLESKNRTPSKVSASFVNLEEGFQSFGNDLNKLQQFVEINATAFSKILKKWDKASKSRTKELYLSRAVEVQPCFNRDVISELSDQATTSLLELGAWAEGEKVEYAPRGTGDHVLQSQVLGTDESDADSQLQSAAITGNLVVLKDWTQRLLQAPDASQRLTRAFLSSIAEAPIEAIQVLLETNLVDVHAEDGINERNCLHEASISGREAVLRLGLSRGVSPLRIDVYGRLPLHYACMHGHLSMTRHLIEANPKAIDELDHDNYTPLIHSIVRRQLECVHQLLDSGARIDPVSETEHSPLNLACQYGDIDVCKLLLEKGAALVTDAEGLYPQHLIARRGQDPQILLLLEKHGADLNQRDKLYQWTPLFHAASEGMVACVKVLLDKGANVSILDEKGLPAVYYAAWEGHLECMQLLSAVDRGTVDIQGHMPVEVASASQEYTEMTEASDTQADGIPDLSLPPPIIPFRRYGHNFLDSKTFIQLSFDSNGAEAIKFFNDSKYPAARLTVSSKASDYIPRNVMIPIQEEFRTVSFQVDNLDQFTIDFDIFSTFGSKVIARTVALPTIFAATPSSSGRCVLPLFDPRLRAIGRISFTFQVIKPFQGIPLEISQFETYWKATSHADTSPTTLITGSSLSGEYLQLYVQLTRDGVPVLYPHLHLEHHGISCEIRRMSYREFSSFRPAGALSQPTSGQVDRLADYHQPLATSFLSLKEALAWLPLDVNVALQIIYPTVSNDGSYDIGTPLSIDTLIDAILAVVFDHAREARASAPELQRSMVFAAFNPSICLALNWKQPNYPVLLCNDLQVENSASSQAVTLSKGHNSMSVKESVRIAQSNNFMGLICKSTLLKSVPALVRAVKLAPLVLVSDTTAEADADAVSVDTERSFAMPKGIDGFLRSNGVLRFHESIDM